MWLKLRRISEWTGNAVLDLVRVTDIAKRLCSANEWGQPEYIDHGASAAVYKVTISGNLTALKVYDPEYFEGSNAIIETNRISLQKQLKGHGCEFLIDIIDEGEIPGDGTWYLLMEFCPWPSLEKQLINTPDEKVHSIIKQLVLAVKFLDSKQLVHRDIKPANIVISTDFSRLKLLDFGVMRKIAHDEGSGTDTHKFIATAQYSPPEFLLRDEAPGKEGFSAINIYQIGAVLHDLITKTPIFGEEKATKNKFKLFKAVTERRPRVVSGSIPPRLIALCLAALDKDPTARTASIKLDDFLAEADDLDALRRRVGRSVAGKGTLASPTLAIWRSKVRSWGLEAAQLEADTLGAVTMKAQPLPRGQRWELRFSSVDTAIYLDLAADGDGYSVHVLSNKAAARGPAVFLIGTYGTDVPETGISGALSAQYLYALDAALILEAAPSEQEIKQ